MAQQTKHALGSTALLTLVTDNTTKARKIFDELWEAIDEFEARFSRFRENSELTYFNQQAGKYVSVTKAFERLLVEAKTIAEDTEGLYNPFILPALQQAGYLGSWPNPSKYDPKLDYSARRLHKISELKIIEGKAKIPSDSAIDFGGIGKGYLLDQLADLIKGKHVKGYWFSFGGDIICSGLNDTGQPWKLNIQAAEAPATSVAYVMNTGGERLSLATSGVTKRGGKKDVRVWHHLIDPRTGLSSDSDILTASVVAPHAVIADVFASCVVLLGSQEGRKFLEKWQLSGLFQTTYSTSNSHSLLLVGNNIALQKEPA